MKLLIIGLLAAIPAGKCDFFEHEFNSVRGAANAVVSLRPNIQNFSICGETQNGNLDWFEFGAASGKTTILDVAFNTNDDNQPGFGFWAVNAETGGYRFIKSYVAPDTQPFKVNSIPLALTPQENRVLLATNSFGTPSEYEIIISVK